MTDRLSRLFDWFRIYDALDYYSGSGDNDRDGIPDRADVDDGNGVDCSGAVWAAYAYAWQPDPPPFALSSTSGYADMAQTHDLWVELTAVQRGDILLHSENGDVFHSDGPVGHTELFGGLNANGTWACYGSSGSGNGVGVVNRSPSFWQAALRIPGLEDHTSPVIPPAPTVLEEPNMVATVNYAGYDHAFWLDPQGRLQHNDRAGHVESMQAKYAKPGQKPNDLSQGVTARVSGTHLLVWTVSAPEGWLVRWEWDGKAWSVTPLGPVAG